MRATRRSCQGVARDLVHLRSIGVSFVALFAREGPMTQPIARDPIYRKRGFNSEIIELCVAGT